MIKTYINGSTIVIEKSDLALYLTVEEAEELWQELMNLCGEYRRGEIVERVNN